MKKENMLDYLDNQIEKKLTDFDCGLDWNKKNHTIELIIQLFAENQAEATIEDVDGVTSELDIIEFEDGILFYNESKSTIEKEDYLAVIPFDGKKGIKKSVLDACIEYVGEILAEGYSDLLEFLSDEEKEEFSLTWNQKDFENVIKKYQEQDKEDRDISYPKY